MLLPDPKKAVYTPGPAPSLRERLVARVAELADAVDSKSTDESLVGSTPTPGTSLRRHGSGKKTAAPKPAFSGLC